MKSILFVSAINYEGNRWGRTFPLAKAFSANGFNTTLLVSKNLGIRLFSKEYRNNVTIICFNSFFPLLRKLPFIGIFTISFIFRLIYIFFKKYDYVYSDCGEIPCCGIPCRISQIIHKSIYLSEYSDLLGKNGYYDKKPKLFKITLGWYYLWSIKYFRKVANYVIVLSTPMKKYVAEEMNINQKKIILLPGGSSPEYIKYKQPNGTSMPIKLGYIGVDNYEIEGILPLLKSIKEFKPNSFEVLLFGQKINPETINKLGINTIIKEYGWVDVVKGQETIKNCDIFILMRKDLLISCMGWPNKLGDYMSFGRPVLIDPYGDLNLFVKEHPHGFIVVDKNDNTNLKNTLSDILNNKYDLVKMGVYNREIAENEISWTKRVKTILSNI